MSAPMSTAAWASSMFVIPQIFTFTGGILFYPFDISISLSSAFCALPLSIAFLATVTPVGKSSARPEAMIAAAAFNTTISVFGPPSAPEITSRTIFAFVSASSPLSCSKLLLTCRYPIW